MQEQNSTDFEYDCGDDSFLESDEKRNRIKKIIRYRHDFYRLLLDYLGVNYKDDDICTAISLIYNDDYNKIMKPLCFKFNCRLYNDVEEVTLELEKFNRFVVESMKSLAKNVGNEALSKGIIRDSNGRDKTDIAFRVMEKALTAAKMKRDSCSNKAIVDVIIDGERTPEQKIKAQDDVSRHLKNALALMERVKIGTFPYNEHGEWKLI